MRTVLCAPLELVSSLLHLPPLRVELFSSTGVLRLESSIVCGDDIEYLALSSFQVHDQHQPTGGLSPKGPVQHSMDAILACILLYAQMSGLGDKMV